MRQVKRFWCVESEVEESREGGVGATVRMLAQVGQKRSIFGGEE